MKVDCLIIDDEKELADNTCEYFNMFDVKTAVVYSSAEARTFLRNNEVRMILLDINLADGNGFELCKHIRQTLNIPILFISARNTDDDKIIALNIGGDDYIEKPYSLGVLFAKVKVVLKRFAGQDTPEAQEDYDDGYLKIDSTNKTVFVLGQEKKITAIEWKLLEYLIANKNRLVGKNEIFDNVWNDKYTTDGTLNVHIRKIREAIEKDAQNPEYIVTVWKEGYKFIAKKDRR
ncbi:MAG: response regulator transcription factor [Lachnospiraceae bacterium]|nr:response regulator transcription factor [Lachnospiraceae bacterium]